MHFSAVLLAGGKSSRMGRDKALLEIQGQPLWQRQLATLGQLSPRQLMFAGPAPPECHCQIISDEIPDAGPLAGLAAALRHCTAPLLVVLAVDLPHMTADFLGALLAECHPHRGLVPRTAFPNFDAYAPQNRHRYEPLAAVYPAACLTLAIEALARGEFSMQAFARRGLERGDLRERILSPEESYLFTNLNTPADYERFREREIHPSR